MCSRFSTWFIMSSVMFWSARNPREKQHNTSVKREWPPAQQNVSLPSPEPNWKFSKFLSIFKDSWRHNPWCDTPPDALAFEIITMKIHAEFERWCQWATVLRRTKISDQMWLLCNELSLLFFQRGEHFWPVWNEILPGFCSSANNNMRKLKHFIQYFWWLFYSQ